MNKIQLPFYRSLMNSFHPPLLEIALYFLAFPQHEKLAKTGNTEDKQHNNTNQPAQKSVICQTIRSYNCIVLISCLCDALKKQ